LVKITARGGRNRLFYNQYRWCINFTVPGSHCISSLDTKKNMQSIDFYMVHSGFYRSITPQDKINLMTLLAWLQSRRDSMRTMMYHSEVSLFTNDRDLLDQIQLAVTDGTLGFLRYLKFSEAVIDMPPKSILRSRSRFRYRSYLREKRVTPEQKATFRAWLQNQPSDQYQINPAFNEMLGATKWQWYRNSYFVDYKDLSFGTMLSLIVPVRETLSIQRSR
jgi:hypothetical protein